MSDFPPAGYRLMIVDDDAMTREVLALLAEDAGFNVIVCESGAAALVAVATPGARPPDAILADLQMPGPTGDTLARLLRDACGPETTLLAMSGTAVPAVSLPTYDAFLLKPFSIDTLRGVLAGAHSSASPSPSQNQLNDHTFNSLSHSIPKEQLRQLYTMCLDDADARIDTLRQAAARHDADAYRRAAHSIKGGCGMVGASELAAIATAMETDGPPDPGDPGPFEEFLSASLRLRRILDARLA